MFGRRHSLPMLDPRYTRLLGRASRFVDPPAGTHGTKGNRPPYFASQIDAAKALHNRLHGDRVAHG